MWIRKRGQTNRFSKCRSELGRWGMVFPDRRKCICRERWPWKRAAYPPALRAHSAPVAYGWVLRARHECWAGLPHSEGEVQRCPWEGSLVNVNKYCRHVFYIFYIDKYYILIYNLRNSGRPSQQWMKKWMETKKGTFCFFENLKADLTIFKSKKHALLCKTVQWVIFPNPKVLILRVWDHEAFLALIFILFNVFFIKQKFILILIRIWNLPRESFLLSSPELFSLGRRKVELSEEDCEVNFYYKKCFKKF